MLWLCLHFPCLPIELRRPLDPGAAAITSGSGARRILIACNSMARRHGLESGLDAVTALARDPLLMFIERDVAAEKRALEALAGWAEQFSSDICLDTQRWLVWLEVGASATYFGSLPCLLATI